MSQPNRATRQPFLLWLALALAGCNCGHGNGNGLSGADALPVAPDLDFGAVPLGQVKALPLSVKNQGTVSLQVSSTNLGGANPGDFRVLTSFSSGIAAGESAVVQVQFTPQADGARSATLTLNSNSRETPDLVVNLTGVGGDVAIAASPQPLNFGDVLVGLTLTLPLTLTNQGKTASDPLTLQALQGPQAAEFTQASNLGALQPSQAAQVQVTFSPTQAGPASASLPIVLCQGCAPTLLALVGQGIQGIVTFVPDPVGFTSVPVNHSQSIPVTATNSGSANILVASLGIQNGDTAFSLSGLPAFPLQLSPGQSINFQATYLPTQAGGDQDAIALAYASEDDDGGLSIPTAATDPLAGNVTLSPCALAIAPPSINFGSVQVGTAYTKTTTLTNSGQLDCSITAIALDPTSDPAYTLASGTPSSLTVPAGGSAQITADCDVQTAGSPSLHAGAIDFQSNDPANASGRIPLTAYVAGTSPYAQGWPKWHNDNTDQGQSEADTSNLVGQVAWKYPVAAPSGFASTLTGTPTYMNSPVVGPDGTVYQTTLDGQLIAVDPSGALVWSAAIVQPIPDTHPATPIIAADNTIYLESGTDPTSIVTPTLYHFAPDGGLLYKSGPPTGLCNATGAYAVSNNDNGCPDGFDVCPSISNGGLLLDADDFGATATYTQNADGTLTQGAGTILQYNGERVAVAVDDSDNSYWCSGTECFKVSPPGSGFTQVTTWPSIGATIVPSGAAGATAFGNTDLAWDRTHTGWLMVETALSSIFGGSATTYVGALDPQQGAVQWSVTLPSFTTPTPSSLLASGTLFSADFGNSAPAVADDGTVYVGNGDGLYAFDGATGKVKTGFPFSSADVDTAAAIGGDGTVFFGCSDGTFYAVNPDGSLRFKIVTGGRISASPAIAPDGTVYFVSDEGNLYAIR